VFFASDNSFGVRDEMIEALARANHGPAMGYGGDRLTKSVERRFAEVFETEVSVFMVATGTAANALSLAAVAPPYGAVFCHEEAHIMVDECGAPEFYTGGAKLIGIAGADGKISADALKVALATLVPGNQHHVQPAAVSLTQATEVGTVYTTDEIASVCEIARSNDLAVHMDGARFANALVSGNVSPADLTWRAGVDILSFGATKNGAFAAEAIIVFSRAAADDLMYRRKRAGHLLSKSRFVAAQFGAYFADDLWLRLARHANGEAARLASAVRAIEGVRLGWPVEANEIFLIVPAGAHQALVEAGAVYHPWPGAGPAGDNAVRPGEILIRLVTSFATTDDDVERFVTALKMALKT